jgi:hypothetical protein
MSYVILFHSFLCYDVVFSQVGIARHNDAEGYNTNFHCCVHVIYSEKFYNVAKQSVR